MADQKAPQMQATLGLTGLTSNAMALIAPGAFLWLTFFIQATTGVAGQPSTAPSMWLGIFAALLLCLATAVAYAEISKLYPGTGSSYYYAEQAMLSKDKAFKYARVAKFIVGWGSHLYYWVYPGVMVAVTGVFVGYVVGFLYPNFISGANPGPLFMALVAVRLLLLRRVDRIQGRRRLHGRQHRHQRGADLRAGGLQRAGPRLSRQPSRRARPASSTTTQTLATYTYQFATAKDGSIMRDASGMPLPLLDAAGKPVPFTIAYPDDRFHRQLPRPPQRCFGHRRSQVQLDVHSGHGRHSDPGRLRIGHLDGRRGKKSDQAYSHRRHCVAADSGTVLLPV